MWKCSIICIYSRPIVNQTFQPPASQLIKQQFYYPFIKNRNVFSGQATYFSNIQHILSYISIPNILRFLLLFKQSFEKFISFKETFFLHQIFKWWLLFHTGRNLHLYPNRVTNINSAVSFVCAWTQLLKIRHLGKKLCASKFLHTLEKLFYLSSFKLKI